MAKIFVESKPRTYDRRVASGRTAGWQGGVGQDCLPTELSPREQSFLPLSKAPVESKTRTYHGRVGSGRTAAWRGGVEQDWTLTDLFA